MILRFLESFSPPVLTGYAASGAGLAVSFVSMDQALSIVVKLLTIVTILLAIWMQIKALSKK